MFSYPFWARNYTLWLLVFTSLVLLLVEAYVLNFQGHWEGYVFIAAILIAQYFFTEKNAKYWSISLSESGLNFHEKENLHELSWKSIRSVREFPSSSYQPVEWSQALMSSGILIETDKTNFVIYRKISGYKEILNAIKANT